MRITSRGATRALGICMVALLLSLWLMGCSSPATPPSAPETPDVPAAPSTPAPNQNQTPEVSSEANKDIPFSAIPQDAVISAVQLHDELEGSDAPFVVDIRSAGTYTNGFIKGSHNIPAGRQFDLRLDEIPHDRSLVLISSGQSRLAEARQTLIDAGYDESRIRVVGDGFEAWQQEGYPTDSRASLGC